MNWFEKYKAGYLRRYGLVHSARRKIYCLSDGIHGCPVKIGLAEDVERRARQLQQMTWRPLVVHWSGHGWGMHEYAIKMAVRSNSIRGEWFSDGDDMIKGLITGFDLSVEQMEAVIARMANAKQDEAAE